MDRGGGGDLKTWRYASSCTPIERIADCFCQFPFSRDAGEAVFRTMYGMLRRGGGFFPVG